MAGLRKIAKIIIPILQVMVICFVVNATINQHYHKLSSGLILNHAHPYSSENNNGTPYSEHQHSSSEYILLDQISFFALWISLFAIFLLLSLPEIHKVIIPFTEISREPDFYYLKNYHAPPAT